jgi:hypothetical protein
MTPITTGGAISFPGSDGALAIAQHRFDRIASSHKNKFYREDYP